MQLKPYLNVLVPTEKHNFDHQRTPKPKEKPRGNIKFSSF